MYWFRDKHMILIGPMRLRRNLLRMTGKVVSLLLQVTIPPFHPFFPMGMKKT